MPARSSWKGYVRVSLVSVPVKAFTASNSSSGEVRLNQLHEECHSRIQYKKVCPVHGDVPAGEIVSGYEFAKGQYVVIDTDELQKLRHKDSDKTLGIDSFLPVETIDSRYHSGKTYYLTPDGPIAQKPYALIREAMAEEGVNGIGTVVMSGREQVVLLRPLDDLLAMTVLQHATKVKEPASFEDDVTEAGVTDEELQLTKSLIDGLTVRDEEFDFAAKYPDVYTEKLTALIEAKVEGRELVSPAEIEEPQVINLMDALKESVNRVKPPTQTSVASEKKPKRKAAASSRKRAKKAAKKKAKKTG